MKFRKLLILIALLMPLSCYAQQFSGGGGKTQPAGLTGQFQYNSAGAFGAAAGLTTDGTSVAFNGNAAITTAPTFSAAANNGWKFCFYTNVFCTGIANATEAHYINFSGNNEWLSFFDVLPANNGTATTPDSAAGISLGSTGSIVFKEVAAPTSPGVGFDSCYGDSTAHKIECSLNGSIYSSVAYQGANGISAGTISIAAATSGLHTFTTAYGAAPACTITEQGTTPASLTNAEVSTSTTTVTVTLAASATATYFFVCYPTTN